MKMLYLIKGDLIDVHLTVGVSYGRTVNHRKIQSYFYGFKLSVFS